MTTIKPSARVVAVNRRLRLIEKEQAETSVLVFELHILWMDNLDTVVGIERNIF